jgi:hypothetical protein
MKIVFRVCRDLRRCPPPALPHAVQHTHLGTLELHGKFGLAELFERGVFLLSSRTTKDEANPLSQPYRQLYIRVTKKQTRKHVLYY